MLVAVAKQDHVLSSLEAQHLLSTIHRYRKMRLKPNTSSARPDQRPRDVYDVVAGRRRIVLGPGDPSPILKSTPRTFLSSNLRLGGSSVHSGANPMPRPAETSVTRAAVAFGSQTQKFIVDGGSIRQCAKCSDTLCDPGRTNPEHMELAAPYSYYRLK